MEKLKFSFMKKLHIGLLPRILIAIAFGILFGNFLPGELVRLFVTFNGIFSEFLNFSIPLIIVGLVTVAIADIGKGAGKLLLITALIAYGATLFSGFLSYFTGVTIFPHLIESGAPLEEVSEAQGILPFFSVAIPPLMNVMTALVLAFTLGLGLAQLKNDTLKNAARDFQDIIVRMISAVILPLLPIYIFGIFLNMTHSGQVFSILMVFIKIIGVIFLLHIFLYKTDLGLSMRSVGLNAEAAASAGISVKVVVSTHSCLRFITLNLRQPFHSTKAGALTSSTWASFFSKNPNMMLLLFNSCAGVSSALQMAFS